MDDPTLQEQIKYSKRVLRDVIRRADQLGGIAPDDEPAQVATGLHATIIELLAGCIELATRGCTAGIPILLRTMFEALVDLDNFGRYGERYYGPFQAIGFKKLLKFSGSKTRVASGITASSKQALDECATKLAELKAKGISPLNMRDRCKRVDREAEYLGMFRLLSMETHNHIGVLGDRHFTETDTGGIELTLLGEPSAALVAIRLNVGVGYLIDSAMIIHGAFGTPSSPAMIELGKEYDARKAERFPDARPPDNTGARINTGSSEAQRYR
jgi:hypothetical protein